MRLSRDVPTRLFDGERCWCHPRAGIVPGAGKQGMPRVVMTMNTMHLEGSDVFKGMFGLRTDDLGKTWPQPSQGGVRVVSRDPKSGVLPWSPPHGDPTYSSFYSTLAISSSIFSTLQTSSAIRAFTARILDGC